MQEPDVTVETGEDSHATLELTIEEASKRAGCSTDTIRRAVKRRLLKRCNPAREPPRFTVEAVQDFIAEREGDAEGLARVAGKSELDVAKADAVTMLVSEAQGHAREFANIGKEFLREARMSFGAVCTTLQTEIGRLTRRVTELEAEREDVQAACDKLREHAWDLEEKKRLDVASLKKLDSAIGLAELLVPAAFGAMLGDAKLKEAAMGSLFDSLTQEQTDVILRSLQGALSPDQIGAVMLILQRQEARKGRRAARKQKPAETEVPAGCEESAD